MDNAWSFTYLTSVVEGLENRFVHFHEDHLICDAGWETGLFGLGARFNNQQELLLNVGQCGWLDREVKALAAGLHHKQVV